MKRRGRPASFDAADENLAEMLDSLAGADNYLALISSLVEPYLAGPILEVGAGHGDLTGAFAEIGPVHATDVSIRCLGRLRDRFAGDERVSVDFFDLTDPAPAPAASPDSFGSAVLVNVLEHLEDDVAALSRLGELLRPGGHVVIFVPAFEFLYGRFDHLIGHHRRYRKRGLEEAFVRAGLEPVSLRYVNLPGWFAWLLAVRVGRMIPSSGFMVTAYDRAVIPVVSAVERRFAPPFGQSLIGIARKV